LIEENLCALRQQAIISIDFRIRF